jgi:hypothetical protein
LFHIGASVAVILSMFGNIAHCETLSKKISNEISGTGSGISSSSSSGLSSVGATGPSSSNAAPLQQTNSAVGDQYRDYGATYYYPGQKQVLWNRDSYADAASDFGYNPAAQQQPTGHSSHTGGHQSSYVPTSEYGSPEGKAEFQSLY